jgi:hypothetical protein
MRPLVVTAPASGRSPFHISWGALFAGAAAALAMWVLLYALGLALGLSTVDPKDTDTLRATGVFTGIWGLATPLVALFIGGLVAGRSAGPLSRGGGAIHGLVVWSLTALAGLYMVVNLFGNALGSAVAVGKNVASQAIEQPGTDETAAEAAGTAPADGVVGDVQKTIGRVQAKAAQNIKQGAIEAAPKTGTAFWVVFGALLLGALAAIAGGAAGVARGQQRLAEAEVIAGTQMAEAVSTGPRTTLPGVTPAAVPDSEVENLRAEIAELRGEIRELIQNAPSLHH